MKFSPKLKDGDLVSSRGDWYVRACRTAKKIEGVFHEASEFWIRDEQGHITHHSIPRGVIFSSTLAYINTSKGKITIYQGKAPNETELR